MKCKLNNWEYELRNGVKVTPDRPIETPDKLCKYYALNENNVNAFLKHQIYASQLDQLNDLFETPYFSKVYDGLTNSQFEKVYKYDNPKSNDFESYLDEMEYNYERLKRSYLHTQTYFSTKHLGIVSLTKNNCHDLMWAHYTNNKGFLVEFNHNRFKDQTSSAHPFGPFPINYLKEWEEANVVETGSGLYWLTKALTKKSIWDYEDEYRYLFVSQEEFLLSGWLSSVQDNEFPKRSRLISYSKEAINKVILGFNFFIEERDNHLAILQNDKTALYTIKNISKQHLLRSLYDDSILVGQIMLDYKSKELKPYRIEIQWLSENQFKVTNLDEDLSKNKL